MSLTISSTTPTLASLVSPTVSLSAGDEATSAGPSNLTSASSVSQTIKHALSGTTSLIANLAAALSVIERSNGTATNDQTANSSVGYYSAATGAGSSGSTIAAQSSATVSGTTTTNPSSASSDTGTTPSNATSPSDSTANSPSTGQVTFAVSSGTSVQGAPGSQANDLEFTIAVDGKTVATIYTPAYQNDRKATATQNIEELQKYNSAENWSSVFNQALNPQGQNGVIYPVTEDDANKFASFAENAITNYYINNSGKYSASTLEAALNGLTSSNTSASSGATASASSGSAAASGSPAATAALISSTASSDAPVTQSTS